MHKNTYEMLFEKELLCRPKLKINKMRLNWEKGKLEEENWEEKTNTRKKHKEKRNE